MKRVLVTLAIALGFATAANAQISVGIGLSGPGVSLGLNLSSYPNLVLIPGYPVYYDPDDSYNYFFYDGLYWVYQDDDWYSSSWYNGPWSLVDRYYVPLFLLRVPVRYYRRPPSYFRGWGADTAPRWDEHWGRDWGSRRSGWNQWDRQSAPRPAPLPTYQRQYTGDRYPRSVEQQQSIRTEKYRYQPAEPVSQRYLQQSGSGSRPRAEQPERATPDRQRAAPPASRTPAERTDQGPSRDRPQQEARPQPQQQARPQQEARPQQQQARPQQEARPRDEGRGQGRDNGGGQKDNGRQKDDAPGDRGRDK